MTDCLADERRKVTVTITERRPRLVGGQLVDGDCHPFGVIGYGLEEGGGHKKVGAAGFEPATDGL